MSASFWFRLGAIWGFLAVAMGAFGAHGLKERFHSVGSLSGGLSAERLEHDFQVAAQYHMYCALALLGVGAVAAFGRPGTTTAVAGWSLFLGSVVFSGTLYVLAVTGIRWLGAITPLGGLLMMVGWLALAAAAGAHTTQATPP